MTNPLIIFDCDGVLVDTETLANTRIAAFFTELGYPLTMAQARQKFQGKSVIDLSHELKAHTGRLINPEEISAQIDEALQSDVQAIEGVESLINTLIDKDIPICVASSGSVEKMQMTLGQTNLLPFLNDNLFSSFMVARGKPFPDVFEYAATQMQHNIKDAYIIEDSVTGVIAGVAAGARVLGYCGDPFNNPDKMKAVGATVFHDMSDVLDLIDINAPQTPLANP